VHQPAEVDGELVRLGSRQQHAVVERVQEPRLADPALLLDEDAVHHRDLPGGTAEAERRDLRPDPDGLAEGHAMVVRGGGHAAPAGWTAGQAAARLRRDSAGSPRSGRIAIRMKASARSNRSLSGQMGGKAPWRPREADDGRNAWAVA
jgi:hypothetical protein